MIDSKEARQIADTHNQKTSKQKRVDDALTRVEKKIRDAASQGHGEVLISEPADVSPDVVSELNKGGYNVQKVPVGPEHRVAW